MASIERNPAPESRKVKPTDFSNGSPALCSSKRVLRWKHGGSPVLEGDAVAVEEPLEIRVDTRPVSVTMRTPGHDAELAAGFLLVEGIIKQASDISRIEPYRRSKQGNTMDVFLAAGMKPDFARLTRHVFASSSCGVCGKATIAAVHRRMARITNRSTVNVTVLAGLPGQLRLAQKTFDRTGGLHAAAIFNLNGELVILREDVGRHNAVDKVLGYGLLNGLLPFEKQMLVVSGRTSFEILQKALAGGIPIIAAISAPSSLAVDFARTSRQTLIGFLRGDRMNIYAGKQRIRFE